MNRTAKFISAAGCVLVLAGCAHRQALDRADYYAQQGDWRAALSNCEQAQQVDPESPEAADCIERTRPRAIESALDDARAALRDGAYGEALDHLDYVDSVVREPHTEADQLREEVRTTLRTRLETAMEAGEMVRAYDLANTAAQLYPEAAYVDGAFERIRAHFVEASEAFEQQGHYERAIEALTVVAEHEPHLEEDMLARQRSVREAWVSSLVRRARDHEEKDHPGAALALYARAHQLSGRQTEGVQVTRLGRRLRERGLVQVHWSLDGPKPWRAQLGGYLREDLAALAHIEPVTKRSQADLRVELVSEKANCAEKPVDERTAEQEYVAGKRQVVNEEFVAAQDRLEQTREELRKLRTRKKKTAARLADQRRAAASLEADKLEPAEEKLDDTRAEVERLRPQVASYEEMVADAEAQLERLQSEDASEGAIAGQKATLKTLRDKLQETKIELGVANERLAELEREVDALDAEYAAIVQKRDALQARFDELADEIAQTAEREEALVAELETMSPTEDKEVVEVFAYKVVTWERACVAEVDATVGLTAEKTPTNGVLRLVATTSDETHPDFEPYGVSEDPLEFPKSDETLWAEIDAGVAAEVTQKMVAKGKTHYEQKVDRAIAAMVDRPHAATDMMLELYLAAPQLLSADAVEALDQHLVEHYGTSPLEALSKL